MQTTIQQWGNSLAVRIPKSLIQEMRVVRGAIVDLSVVDGKIVMEPHAEHEYRLEDLLKGVSRQNLHAAVETDGPVGREVW